MRCRFDVYRRTYGNHHVAVGLRITRSLRRCRKRGYVEPEPGRDACRHQPPDPAAGHLHRRLHLEPGLFLFPSGTIHLAVVDPGVGTARKALAATAEGHYFVAPDNGILTYIMEANEDFVAYEITADHYFRKPVSATFHGRDIFAPIAAWISRRIELHQLGPVLKSPVRLQLPVLKRVKDALIQGAILAVDQFGNLITNLKPDDVPVPFKILAGQKEITGFRKTYGEGTPGEVIVVPGSTGYLEIAVKGGSAAAALNLKAGAPIGVILHNWFRLQVPLQVLSSCTCPIWSGIMESVYQSQGSLFQPPGRQSTLRVGPAGWNYKDWEGIVYPSGGSLDALAFLADYCDTIEINSSFYAPPRPKDAAAWARRVRNNPRFRFTAKAWQRLSHERKAADESSLAADCDRGAQFDGAAGGGRGFWARF